MDLFNKKKVAALQKELLLATAKQEATATQLADLEKSVIHSYDELTNYFKPKYTNKYFKADDNGKILYFKVINLIYTGGQIKLIVTYSENGIYTDGTIHLSVSELKKLTITTKLEYQKGGAE